MNYIFCPSYESLFFVLHLWNNGEKEITVITYSTGIKQFCEYLKIEVIYFEQPEPHLKGLYKFFHRLTTVGKELNEIVSGLSVQKQDKFYLLANIISYTGFYLAKLFSGKCNIYFNFLSASNYPDMVKSVGNLSVSNLKVRFLKWSVECILKMKLVIYYTGIKYVIGFDDKFIKQYGIISFNISKNILQLREEALEYTDKILDHDCEAMVLDEFFFFSGTLISHDSMKDVYKGIFEVLADCYLKEHPNELVKNSYYHSKEHIPDEIQKFPTHIPSEFLFKNVKKYVIGFVSATLITAANTTPLKAISFLDLVTWHDKKAKDFYYNFLVTRSDKILFPKDMNELKQLLI